MADGNGPAGSDRLDDDLLEQTDQGIFGLADVIADFDPGQLDTLRRVAAVIRTGDHPGVSSAIALAGSAAQSRFQLFPGDCDYFERVHIEVPTRDEAIATLASVMVETVARAFPHPELQFTEMKLGLHPTDARHGDQAVKQGSPMSWTLGEVDSRTMVVERPDGSAVALDLVACATDPGFVKLDWVFADAAQDRIVAVSKVIDATWGSPTGEVVPLDGVLDSFYQEVYLDPGSRPHVERLIDQLKPDGLEQYIAQLEGEITKYVEPGHENYGKVAKRLYNIFRITRRHDAAAYLRGLFDDPPARLYQVPAGLYALSATLGTHRLSPEALADQIDNLATILADCYEGADRDELVALVRSLPDLAEPERSAAIDRVTDAANQQVSDYFADALDAHDEVRAYLAELRTGMSRPRPDLCISADIEADGPIPGRYSMLSFGLCVVGRLELDGSFTRRDLRADTFYRELRPVYDEFEPNALAVSGLDRDRLVAEGDEPVRAMTEAATWVRGCAEREQARAVLLGWPLVFDWMFLHWYFTAYAEDGNPFGHSSAIDIKTLAWTRTGRPLDLTTPGHLPAQVRSSLPHTHNALDDAVEQGDVFANLLEWAGPD